MPVEESNGNETCRCGFDLSSDESHPCHALGYTCKKPAKQRKYLLGGQMVNTWCCDSCWNDFLAIKKTKIKWQKNIDNKTTKPKPKQTFFKRFFG